MINLNIFNIKNQDIINLMTIYALSSGPGVSGVAIIRISAATEIFINLYLQRKYFVLRSKRLVMGISMTGSIFIEPTFFMREIMGPILY